MIDFFTWCKRNFDDIGYADETDGVIYGTYLGRQVRIFFKRDPVEGHIGDDNFDRWANSLQIEFTFDPDQDMPTQLNAMMFVALTTESLPLGHRMFNKMMEIREQTS